MPAPKGHPPYAGCETGGVAKYWTLERIDAEADALNEWVNEGKFIYLKRFAHERGYIAEYFSDWCKQSEKFSQAYKRAKSLQEIKLVEGSLLGKFKFNMAQLVLGCQHDMILKQEQKITGSAVEPLIFAIDQVKNNSEDLVDESERNNKSSD